MISNFINIDYCIPSLERKAVACSPKGLIAPNELVLADNINNAFLEIKNAIQVFENSSCILQDYIEYYGWLGVLPENVLSQEALSNNCKVLRWEELEDTCLSLPPTGLTWEDLECEVGASRACKSYAESSCVRTNCFGKYCMDWSWSKLTSINSSIPVTWRRTKEGESHAKIWEFEECGDDNSIGCDDGYWNVNIPYIDENYDPLKVCTSEKRCMYTGVASKDNIIYATRPTSVCVLSSDYDSTLINIRHTLDDSIGFVDLRGVALDSKGKFFVVDRTLCRVAAYTCNPNVASEPWVVENIWGEPGPRVVNNRFFRPNDIHVDKYDNVWVTDSGNNCIKQYTNTGNWMQTLYDSVFAQTSPQSVAVDETDRVHVLLEKNIRVYSYTGEFLFEYEIDTTQVPKKINTNYNKQIIYVVYETTVRKYTRTGFAFGNLFQEKRFCGKEAYGICQDEYRNTLVTYGDKILKFVHILKQKSVKSRPLKSFWDSFNDVFIDREEYVQDWVYNKALQRMWDIIENFRSSLFYDTTYCKGYRPPIYKKHEVCVGQNEPVTSIVINRCLSYLWTNLCSITTYFDPNCVEPIEITKACEQPTLTWNTHTYITPPASTAQDTWTISSDNLKATFLMEDTCGASRTVYGGASATIVTKDCEVALEITVSGKSVRTFNSNEEFTVSLNGSAVLVAIPPLNSPIFLNNYPCVKAPVNVYQKITPKLILAPGTTYVIVAETTNFTSIGHKDSYYEVTLKLLQPA
jgi:hypothetical protein